jgi:hypothetical protein
VSLHASGRWRLGLTEESVKARPDILRPGQDRAWKKWQPILDNEHRLVIGFQITAHQSSLYVNPQDRKKWPRDVVFIEHSNDRSELTVLSVCVVLGQKPIIFPPGKLGAVIAVVPVGQHRTVQLVATHEAADNYEEVVKDGFGRALTDLKRTGEGVPEGGVFFVHGNRGTDEVPYVSAVPFKKLESPAKS